MYVYEGYYHSLPTEDKIYSKNPNPLIGKDFMKPAAGSFTRAFFDAFRHVNSEIFDKLKKDLMQASSFNSTGIEDVCYLFAQWIEKGHHFGDLSIQIHYGKGNEDKLASGAAWHADAENSLLHFAVTLRGHRVLHSKRSQSNANDGGNESPTNFDRGLRRGVGRKSDGYKRSKGDKMGKLSKMNEEISNAVEEILEPQNPGDVYLSSSALMRHAPQFFDSDYSNRVIAIHARILYTCAEIDHFRKMRTPESWNKLTNLLANTLSLADLRIPSLEQVESRLELLS